MGGWAADFDQGGFLGYWGGGEQARSGGVENVGDLAWGQGNSTGRWLRSIGTGENWAISSCSVGKPAPASREEHQRFLSRNGVSFFFFLWRGKNHVIFFLFLCVCVSFVLFWFVCFIDIDIRF